MRHPGYRKSDSGSKSYLWHLNSCHSEVVLHSKRHDPECLHPSGGQFCPPEEGHMPPDRSPSLIFSTEQTVTLCRAQLKTVYSILPERDQFADHRAELAGRFRLFNDTGQCPRTIYLGHDSLFALAGNISVLVTLIFQRGQRSPLVPSGNT